MNVLTGRTEGHVTVDRKGTRREESKSRSFEVKLKVMTSGVNQKFRRR